MAVYRSIQRFRSNVFFDGVLQSNGTVLNNGAVTNYGPVINEDIVTNRDPVLNTDTVTTQGTTTHNGATVLNNDLTAWGEATFKNTVLFENNITHTGVLTRTGTFLNTGLIDNTGNVVVRGNLEAENLNGNLNWSGPVTTTVDSTAPVTINLDPYEVSFPANGTNRYIRVVSTVNGSPTITINFGQAFMNAGPKVSIVIEIEGSTASPTLVWGAAGVPFKFSGDDGVIPPNLPAIYRYDGLVSWSQSTPSGRVMLMTRTDYLP